MAMYLELIRLMDERFRHYVGKNGFYFVSDFGDFMVITLYCDLSKPLTRTYQVWTKKEVQTVLDNHLFENTRIVWFGWDDNRIVEKP